MPSKKAGSPTIYTARQGFYVNGTLVPAGATVVAGHELLKGKGRMALFEPFQPTFGRLEYGEEHTPVIVAGEPEPEAAPEPEPEPAEPEPEPENDGGDA